MHSPVRPPGCRKMGLPPVSEQPEAHACRDEFSFDGPAAGLHLRPGEIVTTIGDPECQFYLWYTRRFSFFHVFLSDWRV